jgi:hypothetical protein
MSIERSAGMRIVIVVLLALALAGCRGEPVPRDYQNEPPAMTHPANSKAQTPTANGMPTGSAEPSSGAEGSGSPYKPVSPLPATSTLKDQAPANTSTATATSGTVVTTTRRP